MAKEFKRDNLLFSLCGLNCSLCPMFVRNKCTGCIEGSMCYRICNIAPCSIDHGGVDYCFECDEYECKKYEGIDENDSLITHINQLRDMKKAKSIGIDRYNEEQQKKVEILHYLLENYNLNDDKEVFFCTAVNLLSVDDLLLVTNVLDEDTEGMDIKEKYNYVKDRLFECAEDRGIRIELRKGRYNKKRITFD